MRDTDFNRHFDIEGMLSDNAVWLSFQIRLPREEFVEIAKELSMGQEDWNTFWRETRQQKAQESVREQVKKEEGEIECSVLGRDLRLTQEEFDFVKQLLGQPSFEESNCCGASVDNHNDNDHSSRCLYCKEGCGVVYVWQTP